MRKALIIGKEVRFVLVVACSYHLQPILQLVQLHSVGHVAVVFHILL